MKVVIQRVSRAEVRIDGEVVGKIGKGFMLLVGVTQGDTKADAEYLAGKVARMRVFEDAAGKMNLDLAAVGGDILSISQFTLYADCRHGNRPSFIDAARPDIAEPLYNCFNEQLCKMFNLHVETGRFGADMKVNFVNDGPVTIILESEYLKIVQEKC